MSILLFVKDHEVVYNEYYNSLKSKGLSDRDADIVATSKIYMRSVRPLSEKYNLSVEEIKKISSDNW